MESTKLNFLSVKPIYPQGSSLLVIHFYVGFDVTKAAIRT